MKTKVIRFCESCLMALSYAIVYCMAAMVLAAVGFAFWQLITTL